MGLLDGKVAVITGAARGQGRAHAIRFAEEGADIIALDICRDVETLGYNLATPEDLRETVAAVESLDRRIIATETDTRDLKAVTEAVDRGVAEFGHVDVLVANAGIGDSYSAAEEMSEERWLTMIDINLNGVWRSCRAVIPHLIEAGRGGCLILTSSSAAYVGLANLGHYSAAKAGVVGLMQSLAVELGPHMIRVNTLHPTTVNTPMALNQITYDLFLPGAGLSADRAEDEAQVAEAFTGLNAMPIPSAAMSAGRRCASTPVRERSRRLRPSPSRGRGGRVIRSVGRYERRGSELSWVMITAGRRMTAGW